MKILINTEINRGNRHDWFQCGCEATSGAGSYETRGSSWNESLCEYHAAQGSFDFPDVGIIRKIRRRIEDRLRKEGEETLLSFASLLRVKISE